MDVIERVRRWAVDCPEKIAHISGESVLTYGELGLRSDNLASRLAEIRPGDHSPVAIIGHKEPEMLIGFLGAAKSGHPYIPIDVSTPARRIEQMVRSSGALALRAADQVAEWSGRVWPGKAERGGADDAFYIIFTSGSTGEPKGVVITLRNLSLFLEWMDGEHRFAPGAERFLNQAPFSFDLSVMDLYLSFQTGGTLFSIGKEETSDFKKLYAALGRSEVTTWVSTPSFARMCLAERSFAEALLPRLDRFLFCGETLAPHTASRLLDRFPRAEVWNTYGPTEATVACTSVRVDREVLARYPTLPVGVPMPGSRITVADADFQPVPDGEPGEILIAGPNVSPGYLGRPDLTRAAFFETGGLPVYRTGDVGYMRDGMLFFENRMDGQVKVNGYRIEIGDIEANLCALSSIEDAVVLPVLKEGAAQSLAAFVIASGRGVESDFEIGNRLRVELAERLPAYMLPRRFLVLDEFPMTANGKTDRRKLAELLA